MPRNQETIVCPNAVWTQITNADVATITFQVAMGESYIRFTADATPPTEEAGMVFTQWTGVTSKPLSELTALVGAVRVWAKPVAINGGKLNSTAVYVDHG